VLESSVRDLDAFKLAPQERTTVWKLGRTGQHAAADLARVFVEISNRLAVPETVAAHG
jgi:hypothetical protein